MRTLLLLLPLLWSNILAQTTLEDTSLSEGPHIFLRENRFEVVWVENGQKKSFLDREGSTSQFEEKYGFDPYAHFTFVQSDAYTEHSDFQGVDKFVALSDIHGKYDIFHHFLKQEGIIDGQDNWNFGTGHLIILGDIMDRGEQVTEALWLTFKLEMQALKAGGRVHYLSGNHEAMVLQGDNRYIHKKYNEAAEVLGVSHEELFGKHTLLGLWLRKRPVMLGINDNLLVHAGLSPDFLAKNYPVEEVNQIFREKIFTETDNAFREIPELGLLAGSSGPIWYRGYFRGEDNPTAVLDAALKQYGKSRVIVGHTSGDEVRPMHDGRLIAIDSYLQSGDSGEVLRFENGTFYRCLINGERILLY